MHAVCKISQTPSFSVFALSRYWILLFDIMNVKTYPTIVTMDQRRSAAAMMANGYVFSRLSTLTKKTGIDQKAIISATPYALRILCARDSEL